MFEWVDFRGYLEGSWVFLILMPLLGALIFWIYQHTYPEVERALRLLLTALRSAAVVLLLLLLAEPVLELWRKQVVRPLLVLLVDTSGSMAVEEQGRSRLARIQEVLTHEDWQQALAPADLAAWGFAEAPYALSLDTLAALWADGRATDLSGPIEKGVEQLSGHDNVGGIVLFSDGVHNLGLDPVETAAAAGAPIYVLAVGEDEHPPDIQIARTQAPEVGYVGQELMLEAEVRAWGYEGHQVEVELYEQEKLLARQLLSLGEDGQVKRIAFAIEPTAAGPQVYRISIPVQEGEFFRDNNQMLTFVRVLAERIRVLLIAGAPGPDLAFLRRGLAADSNLVVEAWVEKENGRFYQGELALAAVLAANEVVILLNVGRPLLTGAPGRQLQQWVEAGGGLLFVGGLKSFADWMPDGPVAQILPVQLTGGDGRFVEQETLLRLSPEGRRHPVVRLQAASAADPWSQLPPLPGYFPVEGWRPGAVGLVEGTGSQRVPIMVAGASGRGRVIAALSVAFWRLELLSSGVGGRPQTVREFWRNAVNWLAIETPAGRVRVSTERPIYRSGEPLVFVAQVFDELLRPQEGAAVQVALEQQGIEFSLPEDGGGTYRRSWSGLGPGDYEYTAQAYAGGRAIGQDRGRVLIEQHSVESMDVRVNPVLLGELARVSGGQMWPLSAWRELLASLPLQQRLVEKEVIWPLWGRSWVVWVVLALLGVEWFVRKRRGMI